MYAVKEDNYNNLLHAGLLESLQKTNLDRRKWRKSQRENAMSASHPTMGVNVSELLNAYSSVKGSPNNHRAVEKDHGNHITVQTARVANKPLAKAALTKCAPVVNARSQTLRVPRHPAPNKPQHVICWEPSLTSFQTDAETKERLKLSRKFQYVSIHATNLRPSKPKVNDYICYITQSAMYRADLTFVPFTRLLKSMDKGSRPINSLLQGPVRTHE